MNKDLKISIALCTYNGEKYLKEQLASIMNQTRLPDELVVCDDVSSDGTIGILTEFQKIAPFEVKININENNLRSTKNFEKCIALCTGDIIFLADQDDFWLNNKLEVMEKEFVNNEKVNLVFTDALVVNNKLESLGYTMWESIKFSKREKRKIKNGKPYEVLLNRNVVTGATMAFRNNKLKTSDFPKDWVHDAWISMITAAIYPNSIKFINESLIKYRQHEANQIGGLQQKHKGMKNRFKNNYQNIVITYNNLIKLERDIQSSGIITPKLMQALIQKIIHFENRKNLNDSNFNNLKIILIELISMRYFKFSRGILSMLKDLFINRSEELL